MRIYLVETIALQHAFAISRFMSLAYVQDDSHNLHTWNKF